MRRTDPTDQTVPNASAKLLTRLRPTWHAHDAGWMHQGSPAGGASRHPRRRPMCGRWRLSPRRLARVARRAALVPARSAAGPPRPRQAGPRRPPQAARPPALHARCSSRALRAQRRGAKRHRWGVRSRSCAGFHCVWAVECTWPQRIYATATEGDGGPQGSVRGEAHGQRCMPHTTWHVACNVARHVAHRMHVARHRRIARAL